MNPKPEKSSFLSKFVPPAECPWLMLLCGQFFAVCLPIAAFFGYKKRFIRQLCRIIKKEHASYDAFGYPIAGLIDGTKTMAKLNTVLQGVLSWTLLALAVYITFAVIHYLRFYREHSVYLMKRVPDRFELHRRCLTVPVILTVETVIAAVLLVLYCIQIYYRYTPESYMPANGPINLWRLFTL